METRENGGRFLRDRDSDKPLGRLFYQMFERGRSMQKVLVTGGNIGNHVAEMLAQKRLSVRVLVRRLTANRRWDGLGIQQVVGDAADLASLAPAFDGVDRFFSVSPLVENLVELGVKTIEAAKKAGVRYIVRSSAMGAGEKAITMGRMHREVERAVEASGIPYTILQPNTFMQSYSMNAETIRRDSALYMPLGNAKVSLVDVRDIAAVGVVCLIQPGHEGKKYVVTGGEALSNLDVADKLTRCLGRKIVYADASPIQTEQAMKKAGMSDWITQVLLELFQFSKAGYAEQVSPAVQQVLQRKPISFDEFLTDNEELFRHADVAVGP